jgi:uncharacterized lipoprotein YajG
MSLRAAERPLSLFITVYLKENVMKKTAIAALIALLAGCSSMESGHMNESAVPQANSTDNVRF